VALTVLHPHPTPIFDPALGIREVHVPPMDSSRLYLRELWRYSGRMAAALDALKPDVVLSQGFCVWKGMRRFSDRLVLHPHGLEMFQGLTRHEQLLGTPFRAAMRHMVRRSRLVVSLGGRLTGILEGLAAGSPCRVVVLPNAVDVPEAPAAYPPARSPLDLLFVGRFAFNKGLDVLVAVAERLVREGRGAAVRFRLAGDGPLLAAFRERGLPPNVELLGRVDDAALDALYRSCHALVLPTRFEGMPTVVLEAMARARPILVSDVGATAELVDAANGHLLPAGDADALHAAVSDLLARNRERLEAMGAESHRRALAHFSWPAVTERFVAVVGGL
jgi:glycosyltransferase involved in cell wall biosynthesis